MKEKYEGILGVVLPVPYLRDSNTIVTALFIVAEESLIKSADVGFAINNNNEPNIKLPTKPIEKSIEELLEGWVPSGRCGELDYFQDQLDELHWLGYAYIMKEPPSNYTGKLPLVIMSRSMYANLDIWEEISTEVLVREINDRINIAEVENDC